MTLKSINESVADGEIIRDPKQNFSTITMLTDAEQQQLIVDRNNTKVIFPGKDLCLHQLIEEQAVQRPDQAALAFEQKRLTYKELNHRADQLAHHLCGLGVGSDMLVGLFVERSLEMTVGILAILKSGAAYVPIDTAYPQERIAFMINDANVTVLLTQTGLLESLPKGAAQIVCLDSFDWTNSKGLMKGPGRVHPGNLAYVIYTSGSTGRPKGVCIEHRNIVNYVLGIAERLQLKPGMNHALVSTIAADLGNTVIFPALITGGCLHIISRERTENQGMLADYFSRENIDVLKIVPSHLEALQTGKNPEQVMPRSFLILGGESSRLDWIERLRVLSPGCEIFNHYGPTETTVGVLTYHVKSQLPNTQSGTLPLGRPLPNSRIYILDKGGQPVPIGEQGELCIGGYGVARGYLNRQDLTAERFIADPFNADRGARLYRTGDLARYLPDRNIEFCGRIDQQIKIHGYRIELGEIEAALREHQGVRDVVVLANENESGTKQLVAYVMPKRANQPLWGIKSLYVLPDGSPVAHLNKNETDYIYNEIFILQAYLRHGITIREGDCIMDAGSNIGLFTVFASRLAKNLRIISFEPNPAAFDCLKANAEAYGTTVRCLPFGLSRENKSADLTYFEGLSLLSGFYADASTEREVVKNYVFNQQYEKQDNAQLAAEIGELIDDRLHAKTVATQLRTLSSVIAEEGIDRIDLLKINVEKSELDVLMGLSSGDWPKIRQLVIEVDQQENLEPITSLLEQHGFEVLVEQDPLLRNTELCYVYAIQPSAAGPRLIRQQQPRDTYVRSLQAVDDEILAPTTLRNYLKERLPQYMLPSVFVLMEKFPLTLNGKIDRQAFPAFSNVHIQPTHDFVSPRTETEKALAAIWTELLEVENIGINDSFFDLGGHSLLAIKAVSRLRDIFDVDLPIQTLFEFPTIADLANVLSEDKGFNIDIQRIESMFDQHPAVKRGIVAVSKDTTEDKRLVAYLVPKEGQNPSNSVLRDYLREQLPEYMVPTTFVILDKFPLTPQGEIDRQSLQSTNNLRPELESAYRTTRTEIEHTIMAIWKEVLASEKIGIDDDFFECGGTLLSSANLIAKINHTCKLKLPLRVIFQERTVSKLVGFIENSNAHNVDFVNSKKERVDLNRVIKLLG
jgi:iturin family lipopeptide synthetase A